MKSELLHAYHKALWMWLAKNPLADKQDWPGWSSPDLRTNPGLSQAYNSECFACQQARNQTRSVKGGIVCKNCPIKWHRKGNCMKTGTLYMKWQTASFKWTKKRYARKIANLKWNGGV